nr:hypothetical protein [Staphylococcus aureus]
MNNNEESNLNAEEEILSSQPALRNGRTKEGEEKAIEGAFKEMDEIEKAEEEANPNIPEEQMKIYEKQARGELPQPGEGVRGEVAEEDTIEE